MSDLRFDANGLIPVVVQDAATGQVLMAASMDRQALERTTSTGDAWYWSRSRQALWRKGEQSGNTQRVREIRVDCDGDAVLLLVDPQGPSCHTGHGSCFYRTLQGQEVDGILREDVLDELFDLLRSRRAEMPEDSYTTSLLRGGREAIADKVREEGEELVRAAREESDRRVVEEAADLLYHTWVLLVERGVELSAVRAELQRRRNDR